MERFSEAPQHVCSEDDCYNELIDTQDYDNKAYEAFQLQSKHRELPDYQFQ